MALGRDVDLRTAILAEAPTWEGTPYHHQASVKGIGADCIGLILGIAQAVGSVPRTYVPPTWTPQWHLHNTHELLQEGILACGGTRTPDPQPGDILLFQFALTASHAAILLPNQWIIHAVLNKRVVRQRYTTAWRAKYVCAYQFPGVT